MIMKYLNYLKNDWSFKLGYLSIFIITDFRLKKKNKKQLPHGGVMCTIIGHIIGCSYKERQGVFDKIKRFWKFCKIEGGF